MQREPLTRLCPKCRRPLTREEVDWCDQCQQTLPRSHRTNERYEAIKEPRIQAHEARISADLARLKSLGGIVP